jgi:hypothetical protein
MQLHEAARVLLLLPHRTCIRRLLEDLARDAQRVVRVICA